NISSDNGLRVYSSGNGGGFNSGDIIVNAGNTITVTNGTVALVNNLGTALTGDLSMTAGALSNLVLNGFSFTTLAGNDLTLGLKGGQINTSGVGTAGVVDIEALHNITFNDGVNAVTSGVGLFTNGSIDVIAGNTISVNNGGVSLNSVGSTITGDITI